MRVLLFFRRGLACNAKMFMDESMNRMNKRLSALPSARQQSYRKNIVKKEIIS